MGLGDWDVPDHKYGHSLTWRLQALKGYVFALTRRDAPHCSLILNSAMVTMRSKNGVPVVL